MKPNPVPPRPDLPKDYLRAIKKAEKQQNSIFWGLMAIALIWFMGKDS